MFAVTRRRWTRPRSTIRWCRWDRIQTQVTRLWLFPPEIGFLVGTTHSGGTIFTFFARPFANCLVCKHHFVIVKSNITIFTIQVDESETRIPFLQSTTLLIQLEQLKVLQLTLEAFIWIGDLPPGTHNLQSLLPIQICHRHDISHTHGNTATHSSETVNENILLLQSCTMYKIVTEWKVLGQILKKKQTLVTQDTRRAK